MNLTGRTASRSRSSTWTKRGSQTRSSTREVPMRHAGGRTFASAMAPCASVMAPPPPCTSTGEDVTTKPKPTHTTQMTNKNIASQRGRAAEGRPPPLWGGRRPPSCFLQFSCISASGITIFWFGITIFFVLPNLELVSFYYFLRVRSAARCSARIRGGNFRRIFRASHCGTFLYFSC